MTNEELKATRESKNLSKSEFADLLGITPMLLGRYEKGSCAVPESIAEKLKELAASAAVTEIEVKKTVRKTARKAKEAVEEAAGEAKEVLGDQAAVVEIEVKKKTRAAGRKAKEKVEKAVDVVRESMEKETAIPNIIIQSPMGGTVTPEDIAKKVPEDTADVYVRVDQNKLYYVLKNGGSGDVNIWE